MNIRTKFFALAGILLLLFGCVIGVLSLLQEATAQRLEVIVAHHQPLRRVLADLDVDTDKYELLVSRLLVRYPDPGGEAALRTQAAELERVAAGIRQNFKTLRTGLGAAVAYRHNDPRDLEVLAGLEGALPFIERQVEPFLALGQSVSDSLVAGRPDEARTLALGFRRYQDAFGPDLGELRERLATLTETAASRVHRDQNLSTWVSFTLFLVASVIGLGIGGIGSGQVVAALRKLVASTRAVEEGRADVAVAVVSRDEVGELARAFNRMVEELRARERIKDTFGKFIDPRIVTRLLGTAEGTPDQAERKSVTIFFSDIKGFSGISERLTAAAMVNLLNSYYSAVAEEIRGHNGIIDKFIGDSVMAFWCIPFSAGDEHALDGCKAALAQLRAVAEMRSRLPDLTGLRRDTPELFVRMGIASGEAVVGVIGSPHTRSYTVIGDTVNLASRLEGVNKVYGTSIILAEDTYRLAHHAIEVRELDVITVTGKREPIRIYELLAEAGELDPVRTELRETFAQGLAAYRHQDWCGASACFEACRRLVPDDGPSAVLLERIARLRAEPPPADWDGVWHLKTK
ncbi:MAG TPA: adenylate/guanylate cyclase domain-containing protein [Aliidongia sp.]|nr:adenylate/guanylate cyclase domain-containing protein [Aliidongia sp.]